MYVRFFPNSFRARCAVGGRTCSSCFHQRQVESSSVCSSRPRLYTGKSQFNQASNDDLRTDPRAKRDPTLVAAVVDKTLLPTTRSAAAKCPPHAEASSAVAGLGASVLRRPSVLADDANPRAELLDFVTNARTAESSGPNSRCSRRIVCRISWMPSGRAVARFVPDQASSAVAARALSEAQRARMAMRSRSEPSSVRRRSVPPVDDLLQPLPRGGGVVAEDFQVRQPLR